MGFAWAVVRFTRGRTMLAPGFFEQSILAKGRVVSIRKKLPLRALSGQKKVMDERETFLLPCHEGLIPPGVT